MAIVHAKPYVCWLLSKSCMTFQVHIKACCPEPVAMRNELLTRRLNQQPIAPGRFRSGAVDAGDRHLAGSVEHQNACTLAFQQFPLAVGDKRHIDIGVAGQQRGNLRDR